MAKKSKNERIDFIKKRKTRKHTQKNPTEKRAARRPAPRAKKGHEKHRKKKKLHNPARTP